MARRHEIHAFQKSDDSNTRIFKTIEDHAVLEMTKWEMLQIKIMYFPKITRKLWEIMHFPLMKPCRIQVIF